MKTITKALVLIQLTIAGCIMLVGCGGDESSAAPSTSSRDLYPNSSVALVPCETARQDTLEQPLEAYIDALTVLAEQGEACAQYGLGTLYQMGYEKIEKDPELSRQYLSLAAEQGHSKAMQQIAASTEH